MNNTEPCRYADMQPPSPICWGPVTFDRDPYLWEIHQDDIPVWECEGHRYESGQDI